jgi:Mrp family chromosome partitioning ATPase
MQAEAVRFSRPAAPLDPLDGAPTAEVEAPVEKAAAPVATPAAEAIAEDASFSIASVAHYLHRRAVPVAIAVSPTGDEGSTMTVMLARAVAEQGRTVVLVDMTGSACPTRLMARDEDLIGITDLLCGEAAFGEAIHSDRLSDAHLVPRGAADAARAMRGADRLAMIVDALVDAYDLVIIECGPAETESLAQLTRNEHAEIILSVPALPEEELAELVLQYEEAGYRNLLIMSEPDDFGSSSAGRRAA